MLPDFEIFGIDLYTIMISVGIVVALITFRLLADKKQLSTKVFNFTLFLAVFSIVAGFFFGPLCQSVFNYIATGTFSWSGQTFLSGLLGGITLFFTGYFLIGKLVFKDKAHITEFKNTLRCGFPPVVVGHAFGRIGCLLVGCCYGKINSTFGIKMFVDGIYETRLPTQLYEAVFLFVLFSVMVFLILKKDFYEIPALYLISYGVWRFCIEFLRDDNRGSVGLPISPSQLISVLMIIAGITLLIIRKTKQTKTV